MQGNGGGKTVKIYRVVSGASFERQDIMRNNEDALRDMSKCAKALDNAMARWVR